jgi:threonine dehydratase
MALTLPTAVLERGLVAYSSGNHAQAVAATASLLRVPAAIVMPNTAPAVKIANTRWWGADVVLYDVDSEDREDVASRIMAERGMTLIPPYDAPAIMAGQGTAGLEMIQDLETQRIRPDVLVINCSGGGLSSGVGTALRSRYPEIEIVLVEPHGREKMRRSVRGQEPLLPPLPPTAMDALSGPRAGVLTTEVLRALDCTFVSVGDDEALQGTRRCFEDLRLVVEPGGAASLAAILADPSRFRHRTVVTVASGGNLDPEMMRRALA